MIEKLLTVAQVADILCLSKGYVYHLLRAGRISSVRIGSAVRVRPEDIQRFVQRNLHEPAALAASQQAASL